MIGSRRGPGGSGSLLSEPLVLFQRAAAPHSMAITKRKVEIAIVSEQDRACDPRAYRESSGTSSVNAGPQRETLHPKLKVNAFEREQRLGAHPNLPRIELM